jgi:pilus assembly protein CpaF
MTAATPTLPALPADPLNSQVDRLCERVAELPGDLPTLLTAEVGAVAPLADRRRRDSIVELALARLDGMGELAALLADPTIDEVLVNNGVEVWVERAGALEPHGRLPPGRLEHLIERILAPIGRRIDRVSPIVDARLPDGSRVCAVIAPIAIGGSHLSVRTFSRTVHPLSDFVDATGEQLCTDLLAARCNIVVTGATSSGKTSLLASLLSGIDNTTRLVVLEDTTELAIRHDHVVRLEARKGSVDGPPPVDLSELLRAALRLRPDRLVVGEVRGSEVLGLVQAMNTGHDGSLSTVHANSPVDAMLRLESLVLAAAPSWPLEAIRQQLRRSIDIVIHVTRGVGGRRSIESVCEVQVNSAEPGGSAVTELARRAHDGSTELIAPLSRVR